MADQLHHPRRPATGRRADGDQWGRVLDVAAFGDALEEAQTAAYGAVGKINWDDVMFWTGIERTALSGWMRPSPD